MPPTPTLDEFAEEIVDIIPTLDETDQRIGVALIRRLGQGAPVAITTLTSDVNHSEAKVAERIDRMPGVYRDDDGRVVGYFGITVIEMGKHRLHVDGHTVSAWCAWDTLFLPDVLGQTVDVTSRSPNDDDPISLTVTPDGPRDVTPPETVVTFVPPKADFVNNTIESFCHYVHFFTSPESAAKWTAKHPDTFAVPLAHAYELAEVLTQAVFGKVVPPRHQQRAGENGRPHVRTSPQELTCHSRIRLIPSLCTSRGPAPITEDGRGCRTARGCARSADRGSLPTDRRAHSSAPPPRLRSIYATEADPRRRTPGRAPGSLREHATPAGTTSAAWHPITDGRPIAAPARRAHRHVHNTRSRVP